MYFEEKADKRFYGGFKYTTDNRISYNWHQIRRYFLKKNIPVIVKQDLKARGIQ